MYPYIREPPMTTTFADYAAQQDARNTIELNVRKWSLMLCDALTQVAPTSIGYNYGYELDSFGRKYHKIYMTINGKRDSIHAFIDKKTGEVYKPANTKQPAKGVRYDLRLIEQREWLLENADWAGGYLYAK